MFGLCREILVWNKCMEWYRIDVSWYKMIYKVYYEFWVEVVVVWKEIPVKMAQNWSFLLCLTPLCLGVGVHA